MTPCPRRAGRWHHSHLTRGPQWRIRMRRRSCTATGTNLLGLVKHSTATHLGYFGEVFGRTSDASGRLSGAEQFWAQPHESTQDIVTSYRDAWEFSDATITELPLDAVGRVWWWGDATVTLHHVLVHVIADTQRHAGHADILRELVDGSVGMYPAESGGEAGQVR